MLKRKNPVIMFDFQLPVSIVHRKLSQELENWI